MIAAMEITDETPMMMPSTVRAERTLEERSVAMSGEEIFASLRRGHDRHSV